MSNLKTKFKFCSRCNTRCSETKAYEYTTMNGTSMGRFCINCWMSCAFALQIGLKKTIYSYFFPISKWKKLREEIVIKKEGTHCK